MSQAQKVQMSDPSGRNLRVNMYFVQSSISFGRYGRFDSRSADPFAGPRTFLRAYKTVDDMNAYELSLGILLLVPAPLCYRANLH